MRDLRRHRGARGRPAGGIQGKGPCGRGLRKAQRRHVPQADGIGKPGAAQRVPHKVQQRHP